MAIQYDSSLTGSAASTGSFGRIELPNNSNLNKIVVGANDGGKSLNVDNSIYLSSGNQVTWANGDARIIEGSPNNYDLKLGAYNGSSFNDFVIGGSTTGNVFSGSATSTGSFGYISLNKSSQIGEYFRAGEGVGRYLSISAVSTTNVGDTHVFNAASSTGHLKFQTTSIDRMTINSSGVGIGTTTPNFPLNVHITASNVALASFHGTGNSALSTPIGITFGTRTDAGSGTTDQRAGVFYEYNGNLFLAAKSGVGDLATSPKQYAQLYVDGGNDRVGIGTTSPGVLLHLSSSSANQFRIERSGTTNAAAHFKNASDDWYAGITSQQDFSISQNADIASGTEFRIQDSTGNVGIGDTSPTEGKLVVSGDGASSNPTLHLEATTSTTFNHFVNMRNSNLTAGENGIIVFGQELATKNAAYIGYVHRSDHGDDNQLTLGFWSANNLVNLLPNGNFGIGTESPGAKLDIVGPSDGVNLRLSDVSGNSSTKEARIGMRHYTEAEEDTALMYAQSGNGTSAVYIGGGTGVMNAVETIGFVTAATDTTLSGTTRMVIDNSGNVGIGQTNPQNLLQVGDHVHVSGSGLVGIGLAAPEGDLHISNASPMIILQDENVSNLKHRIIGGGDAGLEFSADINNVGTGYIRFDVANSEAVRIVEGGKVGIGITSPDHNLHVSSSGIVDIVAESQNFGIKLSADNTNSRAIIILDRDSTDGVGAGGDYSYFRYDSAGLDIGTGENLPILFEPNGAERVRITTAGIILNSSAAHVSASATSTASFGHIQTAEGFSVGNTSGYTKLTSTTHLFIGSGASTVQMQNDLIPDGDASYSLGNSTRQWSQVFVKTKVTGSATSTGSFGMVHGANEIRINPTKTINTTVDNNYWVLYGGTSGNGANIALSGNSRSTYGGRLDIAAGNVDSSGVIAFYTGGSEKVQIDYSGNVGIGLTAPSRKIHINQTVTTQGGIYVYSNAVHTGAGANALICAYSDNASANGDTLYVRNDGTGNLLTLNNDGTDRLVVRDGGNVGIGTTSTTRKLSVAGTIHVSASDAAYSSDNWSRYLELDASAAGGGGIIWKKQSSNISRAILANQGDMYFARSTADDSSAGATYDMFIKSTGNVGIGTTNPTGSLHVMAAQPEVIIQNSTQDGSSTMLRLAEAPIDGKAGGFLHYDGSANKFHIGTHISGTDTKKITILRDSTKVGIGTDSPDGNLHIFSGSAGTVTAHGNGDELVIEGSATEVGMTFLGSTSSNQNILFGDPDDHKKGYIIYAHSTDSMTFGTAAENRMFISGSGNVGIGTTSPSTTRRLHIYNTDDTRGIYIENTSATSYAELHLKANREFRVGTGGSSSASEAQNRFYVYDATAAAHRFTIDSSGNVGIGTTSPSRKLEVSSDTDTYVEIATTAGGSDTWLYFRNDGDNDAATDYRMGRTNTGNFILQTGNGNTSLLFGTSAGNIGIGTASPAYTLAVEKSVTGDWLSRIYNTATSGNPSGLLVRVDDADSTGILFGANASGTYRFVVKPDGNVGIGTTSPTTFSGFTTVHHKNSSGDTIMLGESDGGVISQIISSDGNSAVFFGARSNHALTFTTNDTRRITVDTSGNVGIGTTSPGQKLTLQGGSMEITGSGGSGIFFTGTSDGSNKNALYFRTQGGTEKFRIIHDAAADGTNDLQIKSNSSSVQVMTMLQNGRVGIGTTSPEGLLHIFTADASIAPNADADELIVENSGNAGISILSGNTSNGAIFFGDAQDNNVGIIDYDHNVNQLSFTTGATKAMTINSSANVGIGTTSPGTKLDVVGGNWNTSLTIKGGGSTSGIKFLDSDNNIDGYIYAAGGTLSLLDSGGDYMINILNDDSIRFAVGASEKMRILNSGNVGIGTENPGAPLHVSSSVAGVAYLDSGHTNGPHVRFRKGGTDQFYIGGSGGIGGGSGYYDHYAISGLGIRFFTAATQALVLDTSQNATFAGNVSGSASSTGSFGHLKANSIDFEDGFGASYMKYNSADIAGDGSPSLTIGDVDGVNTGAKLTFDVTNQSATFTNTDLFSTSIRGTSYVRGPNGSESNPGLQLGTSNDGFFHDSGIKVITNNSVDFLFGDSGDFHADADVVAYSTSVSDKKLKDNIKTIEFGLDKIKNLRGVEFTWNNGGREGQRDIGLIAQEIEKVIPEVVREKEMPLMDDSGKKYKTIDYDKITAVLIEAVKEQQDQIDELKRQVKELRDGSPK